MKSKQLLILIVIAILIIIFPAIFSHKITSDNKSVEKYSDLCGMYDKKNILVGGNIIEAYISDTDCKRGLGLSGREMLKDHEGMIFIFDTVGSHGFWMKDMKFPIDILWLDDGLSLIGIEKTVATSTYPEIFGQNYPSRYVLELPAGYSEENNVKVGNKIIFL